MNPGILTSGYAPPPMPYGLLGAPQPAPTIDRFPQIGFNPRSIPDLALWLDGADAGSMGNTPAGVGGASNNGPVKYWADKSGSGRHATNAGADSVCPTLLAGTVNGRSALRFDGGDFITGNQAWTVTTQTTFVVARMVAGSAEFARLFTQSDAGDDWQNAGHYIPLVRSSSALAIASWAAGVLRASMQISFGEWFVACSRHTGSRITNSLNGGLNIVADGQSLNKTFTRYRVGDTAGTPSATLVGAVAEVLVFTRSLSDIEKRAIDRYLGSKWGITVA